MGHTYFGACIKKQSRVLAATDLIIAKISAVFGLISIVLPESDMSKWDIFTLEMLRPYNPPKEMANFVQFLVLALILSTELCLFTFLLDRSQKKLQLWYRIRLGFFILTFLSLVFKAATAPYTLNVSEVKIMIGRGVLGIVLLIYRGYGLIVVTVLQENILRREIVMNLYSTT